MAIELKGNQKAFMRLYEEKDFNKIQDLNKEEEWTNLVENHLNTKEAWKNSNISYVVETEGQEVVGYIRGFTDTCISLFICELLIDKKYRGLGLGKELLSYVHNLYQGTPHVKWLKTQVALIDGCINMKHIKTTVAF